MPCCVSVLLPLRSSRSPSWKEGNGVEGEALLESQQRKRGASAGCRQSHAPRLKRTNSLTGNNNDRRCLPHFKHAMEKCSCCFLLAGVILIPSHSSVLLWFGRTPCKWLMREMRVEGHGIPLLSCFTPQSTWLQLWAPRCSKAFLRSCCRGACLFGCICRNMRSTLPPPLPSSAWCVSFSETVSVSPCCLIWKLR